MIRRERKFWAVLLACTTTLTGCRPTQPFHFMDDGDLSHFVAHATQIEYPDAEVTSLDEVEGAHAPLTLSDPTPEQIWELSLEEVVKMALCNTKVMRSLGGRFFTSANIQQLTQNPPQEVLSGQGRTTSVYDPAIVESTPFSGVESALAAFDPTLTSSFAYNNNDRPQNQGGQVSLFIPRFLTQDTASLQTALTKTTASGGSLFVRNNTAMDDNPSIQPPNRPVRRDWSVNYELGFSQPLLQGAGVQFNRIAGPSSPFSGGGSAAFDGVMLARLNTDISLADFEIGVRNLVSDAENAYWELNFAYRSLDAVKQGRAAALQTWKKVAALRSSGSKGGEAAAEAQARGQYFQFQVQVQTALNDLYTMENRLRYVIGLTHSDGRLIRPTDEPTNAKVTFDWQEIHREAIVRSAEIRRQKWNLQQEELSLIAARNFLLPRLDVGATYRFLGLGNTLIDSNRTSLGNLADANAYGVLSSGQFQEWQAGMNFSMPLGFRKELSQVRFYQLRVAKARAVLQDQELEVSHQIGDAVRRLDTNYALAKSNFDRRIASDREVDAVEAAYKAGTVTLDQLLDAQRRRADAELAYYRATADYTKAISQVHYRKGSLLEYNGIHLAEGPWADKAYFDAERLARQRDASFYLDYGFTRPRVISQGEYIQEAHGEEMRVNGQGTMMDSLSPTPAAPTDEPETVPVPPPTRSRNPNTVSRPGRALTESESNGPALTRPASAVKRAAFVESADEDAPRATSASHARPAAASFNVEQDDEFIRQAGSDWKSRAAGQAFADRAARADDRSAANWQRSKR